MKLALTADQKKAYVVVAHSEFVRLGLKHSFIATTAEACMPNHGKPFVFFSVDEETSTRTGDRHNATVLNVSTQQTAYLRFGFGVAVNVPLQSEWFEEDRAGNPTKVKDNSLTPFLIAVFGGILQETDPAGVASLQGVLSRTMSRPAAAKKS
jgi:hypothetical protein